MDVGPVPNYPYAKMDLVVEHFVDVKLTLNASDVPLREGEALFQKEWDTAVVVVTCAADAVAMYKLAAAGQYPQMNNLYCLQRLNTRCIEMRTDRTTLGRNKPQHNDVRGVEVVDIQHYFVPM